MRNKDQATRGWRQGAVNGAKITFGAEVEEADDKEENKVEED